MQSLGKINTCILVHVMLLHGFIMMLWFQTQSYFPLTLKLLVSSKTHSCAKRRTTQNL